MTNTELLRKRIKKSGMKIGHIAKEIGISRGGLWKKMNNVSSFNQHEIDNLCKVLKITALKDKEAIFFAKM